MLPWSKRPKAAAKLPENPPTTFSFPAAPTSPPSYSSDYTARSFSKPESSDPTFHQRRGDGSDAPEAVELDAGPHSAYRPLESRPTTQLLPLEPYRSENVENFDLDFVSNPTITAQSSSNPLPPGWDSFDAVAAQVGIIVQQLEVYTDRRARALSSQLISEQSRITTWARDRDIIDIGQLESMLDHLPLVTQRTMQEVCEKLRQWLKSQERVNLFNLWVVRDKYFSWMLEGYDSLETLRTVSHSLLTIVPFLSNRPLGLMARTERHFDDLPSHITQAQESISINSGEKSEASEALVSKKGPTIQFLYSTCLEALRAVTITSTRKDVLNAIHSRLVVWGCGLFQQSSSLDLILEKDNVDSIKTFKHHVIGVLADIGVILDAILRSYDQILDPEVQKSHLRLQACFGIFREYSEAALDEGPDLPEPTEDEGNSRLLDVSLQQMAGLVDCLFDVLPSIDRLRQIWILDLEKRSKELAARMALVAAVQLPEAVQSTSVEQTPKTRKRTPSISSYVQNVPDNLEVLARPDEKSISHKSKGVAASSSIPWQSDYIPQAPGMLAIPLFPLEHGKGKEVGTSSSPPGLKSFPLGRRPKAQGPSRDPRQKSLRDIVTMDLELATALRLSLIEQEARESKERQEDKELMAQLQEWTHEIERLKTWSDVFYQNLGSETSEQETKRLYSIFEQLAKIGGTFASAPPGGPEESVLGAKDIEGKLKIAASAIAKGGQSIDLKLDLTWKSYKEALKAFKEANDNMENLSH